MIEQPETSLAVALGILLLTGSVGVTAFGTGGEPSVPQRTTAVENEETWVSDHVFRMIDEDAGVVCYVSNVQEGSGIDCLPLEQTKLADADDRTAEATNRTDGATDKETTDSTG